VSKDMQGTSHVDYVKNYIFARVLREI